MSITSLLAAYIIEEQTTTFDRIVSTLLESGQGLQDVIELLEQDLTSSEDRVRSRATLLIALLLEHQPLVKASPPVLHLFVVFFSRRMQDYASISPCLTALTTILKLYATDLDPKFCDLLDIIHSTTKSVHIPSYAQNVRQKALELLRLIIDDEELVKQLRGSGGRLLEGLANCIEGEKDPRCLLIGLRSIHLATVKFAANLDETIYITDDQLTIAEHVFDVVSRYYPISFAPPVDDPIGITSEVLSGALEDCMCQTKAIATFAISFLIDQLILEDSDSRVAALTTLSRIIREHGVEILIAEKVGAVVEGKSMGSTASHSKMIIDQDHDDDDDEHGHTHDYDYRNGGIAQFRRLSELLFEASIHEASERILSGIYYLSEAISRSICSTPSIDIKHPIWQIFIEGIIAKVLKEVQATGLDNLKARGAWRLCRSIGQGGGFKTCGLIIEWFLPTAMKGVEESAIRLEVNINRTLKAIYQQVDLLPSLSAQDRIQPGNLALLDGIIQLSSPLEGGLDVSGMQEFQLLSQDRVVSILTLLARFIQPFAVDTIPSDSMVVGEEPKMYAFDDDAFIAIGLAIGAIRELLSRVFIVDNADLYHQLIKSTSMIAMEGMKHFINDEDILKSLHHVDKISPKLQASTKNCLESLSTREKHIPVLLQIACPVLITSSDHYLGMDLIASMAAKENGVIILQHVITQLTQAIHAKDQINTKKYIQACYSVLSDEKCVQVKQKAELFTTIASTSTISIITQLLQMSISSSSQVAAQEVCSLLEKIMQQLVTVEQQMAMFASILDIVQKANGQTSSAALIRSAILYLDKTAVFFSSPLAEQILLQLQGGDDDISNQAVAIIINKIHGDGLQRYLSQTNVNRWSQSLLVWTTKALILRPPLPHPTLPQMTWQSYLLGTILNSLDGTMAAKLQVLVSESDGVLEKTNRGHCSPFWQQKLFATFYPRLKDVIHNGNGSMRVCGMLSFCYVVHGLSAAMLRVQLEEVVDSIVYILSWLNNSNDRSLQGDVLGLLEAQVVPAMTRILQEQPVAFVDHLQTILPRLLQMAKGGGEARLRIAAIDCLASLPSHVPYSKLHPYKVAVLKTLQAMLDDKKRVVRQKAAAVRNEWMLRQS